MAHAHAPRRAMAGGTLAAYWPPAARRPSLRALLPILPLAACIVLLAAGGGDQSLARLLYDWQGGHWALRDHFVTATLLHRGGRDLSVAAWMVTALAAWWAGRDRARAAWQQPLVYLLLSVLVATTCIAWLKAHTHMDCPWDLQAFGGRRAFVPLFAARPSTMPAAACFPAGQAGAGYAWVALYFFAAATRPAWRFAGLAVGLIAGAVLGFAQQLRGAHFLSHDLASLAICWTVALLLARAMLGSQPRTAAGAETAP